MIPRSLTLVAIGSAFVGGLVLGWYLAHPNEVVERYAPPVRQDDSSLVLERKPDATAKPQQMIPPGGKVERVISVTVQPRATNVPSDAIKPAENATISPNATNVPPDAQTVSTGGPKCPLVTIDLTLVKFDDGSRRVVASSPDGQVIGGVDIPVMAAEKPREAKWSLGAVWTHQSYVPQGGFLSRDLGPLRATASAFRYKLPDGSYEPVGQVALGIRF